MRRDLLPERLNAEPAIFKGCTSSELGIIVLTALLLWLPLSLLLAAWLGAITMGFGMAGLGIVSTVMGAASVLQRLKRNRPDGYLVQRVVLWLHAKGLRRSRLHQRSGVWDLGRNFS